MSIIYEPTGKAREYSPLAANFYDGCDHGCKYCYAPGIRRKERNEYRDNVRPRSNIVNLFEKDAIKIKGNKKQILFNFMGDPYCARNNLDMITRSCLEVSLENRLPIAILTKGGMRCIQDLELFKKFGRHIKVGASLTFYDEGKSLEWECGAATPKERIKALKIIHEKGIKTWASFEPVIDPIESIKIMEESIPFVDEYKVGKINNFGGLDKKIDWTLFLSNAVDLLRSSKKPFYIKNDLAEAAPKIKLSKEERTADLFCVTPWTKNEGPVELSSGRIYKPDLFNA